MFIIYHIIVISSMSHVMLNADSLVLSCTTYVKPFDDVLALSELAKPQLNIAMQVLMIRYTHDLNADTLYYLIFICILLF